MIYFFDRDLNIVDLKNELSFSFNKKANREGGGKIEVEGELNKEALYVSIYTPASSFGGGEEAGFLYAEEAGLLYVASGFIAEIQINLKSVSISFNTFEGLLKNSKLPKSFSNFNAMKKIEVFNNLFHSFQPIIKSKKDAFTRTTEGSALAAYYAKGILKARNIVFSKVKDGDFHLGFNGDYSKKNEYRYCEQGAIVFWFDLGEPVAFLDAFQKKQYPNRFLRFTASLGNKTFINVKAIGQDEPFRQEHIKDYETKLKEAGYLPFDRSIKDFEKNVGVLLPPETNDKRFVAVEFIFIYEKPDWVQDFSTLEVYDDAGLLYKRTVRGFTPLLHGVEILNRRAIIPFNYAKREFVFNFDSNGKPDINEVNEINEPLSSENVNGEAKLKFDGISLYDALVKVLDETKYNLKIDLILSEEKSGGDLTIQFCKNDFNKKRIAKKKDEFIDASHILRLHEGQASRLNNFILKALKQKTYVSKMLHCYGEGEGQDVLYLCLFNEWQKKDDGTFEEKIKLFSTEKIGKDDERFKILNSFNVVPVIELPNIPFEEERLEDANIKDFSTLLKKGVTHFIDAEKKNDYSFEVESSLPLNLYDNVLVYYQNGNFELKARVIEIKLNHKASQLHKTYGIGGFLFNPFMSLFQKPLIDNVVNTPKKPFNLRGYTKEGYLYLTWECLGVYDGFLLSARRLDGEQFFKKTPEFEKSPEREVYFYSSITELKLNVFEEKVLYSLDVCSYIGNIKSEKSYSICFKMLQGEGDVHILNSLTETGHANGERGFYLELFYRQDVDFQKKLCKILNLKNSDGSENLEKLKTINDFDSDPNVKLITSKTHLHEDDEEAVRSFLGLEYVWQNGRWQDVRIKAPQQKNISFMFQFRMQDVIDGASVFRDDKDWKDFEKFIDALHIYENARQLLNCLSTHYILPPKSTHAVTYGATRSPAFNARGGGLPDFPITPNPPINPNPPKPPINEEPIDPPIVKPIEPNPDFPITPNPPKPPEDGRYSPDRETLQKWNNALKTYNEKKEELEKLLNANWSIAGELLNLSSYNNNLIFNITNFKILKNQWNKKNKHPLSIIKPFAFEKQNEPVFLDNAIRFYWQSTVENGEFNVGKPSYQIKKIAGTDIKDNRFFFPYTLAFYLKVDKLEGDIELWNIGNYCIGRLFDGCLHFCCKKKDGSYHTFCKKAVLASKPSVFFPTEYIHIMVIFSFWECVYKKFGSLRTEFHTLVSQRIFINFNEIRQEAYENKSFNFQDEDITKSFVFADCDFSLFNFIQKKKGEEDFSNFTKGTKHVADEYYYLKSAYFDVTISHLILCVGSFDYGTRQYLKNAVRLPLEEKKEDKKNEKPIIQGKSDSFSKYKGVCVSTVDKNKVNLYNRGEVSFNEGEFFLMAHRIADFSSGVIYRWTGSFWQELLPYSLYHAEYLQAYKDIQNMKDLPKGVFFKDFLMGVLQVCDVLYSKSIQANLLTIQEGLFLNNIPKRDPHIKGQVYLARKHLTGELFLTVSEG